MSKFDRQIKFAAKMISDNGQAVTWLRSASTVNATQPWKHSVSAPPTETPVTILFLKPKGGLSQALTRLLKGTEVPSGGPRGLMAAQGLNFVPDIADSVLRDGVTLNIKSLDTLSPDGAPIIYDIEFVD